MAQSKARRERRIMAGLQNPAPNSTKVTKSGKQLSSVYRKGKFNPKNK